MSRLEESTSGLDQLSTAIEHTMAGPKSHQTRDNEGVYIPTALIHQGELATHIERAKTGLGPEVAHVAYRIGEDSTGAASIFFRITLLDRRERYSRSHGTRGNNSV